MSTKATATTSAKNYLPIVTSENIKVVTVYNSGHFRKIKIYPSQNGIVQRTIVDTRVTYLLCFRVNFLELQWASRACFRKIKMYPSRNGITRRRCYGKESLAEMSTKNNIVHSSDQKEIVRHTIVDMRVADRRNQ